jgi:hypothetical protein
MNNFVVCDIGENFFHEHFFPRVASKMKKWKWKSDVGHRRRGERKAGGDTTTEFLHGTTLDGQTDK